MKLFSAAEPRILRHSYRFFLVLLVFALSPPSVITATVVPKGETTESALVKMLGETMNIANLESGGNRKERICIIGRYA